MIVHPVKSIFFKLLAAYFIAFLIISAGAVFMQILSISYHNTEISLKNISHYALSLAREIGNPPDYNVAEKIANETGLQIMVQGDNKEWRSFGESEEINFTLMSDNEPFGQFLPWTRDLPVTVNLGEYNYYFSEFHADRRKSVFIWLIMAGSILLALLISFMLVRHFLKPLKVMNQLALEFGVSNWNKRINPRGKDELATLGKAMDSMADRMEKYIQSMHDLLIAVSHELRSPLTRMKVALEFINEPEIKESMNEEITTLDSLTGNLLEQEKLTTQTDILNREKVSLHSWVLSVCRHYNTKNISITSKFSGPDMSVPLDRNRMNLALRNLIENSLRHAKDSIITIILETKNNENGFSLEVSDTGPGMDEALILRTGEPFLIRDLSRTGNRSKGGFGLGLSIVKAITEAHGAHFSVRNIKPHGLTVKLDFKNI